MTIEQTVAGGFAPPELPTMDEYDLLHHGHEWVALSASEAAVVTLLLERYGRVVGRDRLEAAVWPTVGAPPRSMLNQLMIRVRRRIEPLGLEVTTVRGRGYLLRST
ncbi:MAG: transcriptional regulator [Actinomycetia bacterium]|nr:transcriptional regulator [Actinomycetes bacterium]